jgi:two-component system, LytTR family, sensor kinase
MMTVEGIVLAGALFVTILVPALALWRIFRARRAFGTAAQQATFDVLHKANEAAPPFRGGLTRGAAHKAIKDIHSLLGTPAVALTNETELLAWDGVADHHGAQAAALAATVVAGGRPLVVKGKDLPCRDAYCAIRSAVIVPIVVGEDVVGTLGAYGGDARPGLIRAAGEVARWISTQMELAELDVSRARLAEAEVRALRAQISPHFIFNALTAIASFVRTDPERARELLLEFADFTRYSFRSHGQFTTLAEELRSIDKYLALERARFGERLQVTLQVAPEVLPVTVPVFVLQPLVENAVRHGLEKKPGRGRIAILAQDAGPECHISVEDDGLGMDPQEVRSSLAGRENGIGLANVDERLRTVFGADFGLVVETAPGAGTKVSLRIPKYRSGVRAS